MGFNSAFKGLKAVLFIIIEYIDLSQDKDKLRGMSDKQRTY